MSIEFYQDAKEEHRWHVLGDSEDDIIHACHEGFASKQGALHNMLVNHAMMGIFVNTLARGGGPVDSVRFEDDANGDVRWKIQSSNGELVGMAHKGFDDKFGAVDNLIIICTMLSMRVAELAQMRATQ